MSSADHPARVAGRAAGKKIAGLAEDERPDPKDARTAGREAFRTAGWGSASASPPETPREAGRRHGRAMCEGESRDDE